MIDIEQNSSSFSLKLKVPVAADSLWDAWTQSHDLTQWLAPKANVKAEPNGAYELFWEPDHPERNSTIGCRVIEIRDKELLEINWKGPVPFADLMNVAPLPTAVKITFKPIKEQSSIVCLEHYGWGDSERWSQAQAWQLNAWKMAFQELEEYLQMKEKTMPVVGLARFETVAIYVEDLEKALKFYTEILGFEKKRAMGPGCLLELKGQLSLYLEGDRKPRIKKDIGNIPECVLCFSTDEGLKESWNRLKKAGVETFGDYEALSDDFHMFRITDPSGNLIEFAGKP